MVTLSASSGMPMVVVVVRRRFGAGVTGCVVVKGGRGGSARIASCEDVVLIDVVVVLSQECVVTPGSGSWWRGKVGV